MRCYLGSPDAGCVFVARTLVVSSSHQSLRLRSRRPVSFPSRSLAVSARPSRSSGLADRLAALGSLPPALVPFFVVRKVRPEVVQRVQVKKCKEVIHRLIHRSWLRGCVAAHTGAHALTRTHTRAPMHGHTRAHTRVARYMPTNVHLWITC